MSEHICKGEGCDVNLIDAFVKPPSGLGYWCADCLTKKLLGKNRFVCHDCGEFHKDEAAVAEHWNITHSGEKLQKALKVLKKYGQHFPSCAKVLGRNNDYEAECSCEFDKSVEEI